MIRRATSRLRRYLITGLIVIAPVGVTVFVLTWLFQTLDEILGRYLPPEVRFPGLGLIVLLLLLVVVGWASQRAVGRKMLALWNSFLSRLPLAHKIYSGSSQIVQAVLDREEKVFQGCALIEYPSPGSYSLVFVTGRAPDEVEARIGGAGISVFLPTVPNPTTGYLLIVPAERMQLLEMSVEEGLKMVLSAGVAVPSPEGAPRAGLDVDRLTGREEVGGG
ncbi:MAG: DUF502 domain-containing protein [Gemmatimonadota bacterium]